MSWTIDTPGAPSGDADRKIDQIFRYLYRIANQINYALSFLPLPGLSQTGKAQEDADARIAEIGEKSTNAQIPSAGAVFRFVQRFAVPKERTVNGKPLTEDVTLSAGDVDALPAEAVVQEITEDAGDDAVPSAAAAKEYADAVTEGAVKIIASGTDGPWTWEKHSNGDAVLYGHAVPATISEPSEWITDWSEGTATIALPDLFADARYTAIVNTHGALMLGGQNVSKTLLSVTIASPAARYPSAMTIDAVLTGTWEG